MIRTHPHARDLETMASAVAAEWARRTLRPCVARTVKLEGSRLTLLLDDLLGPAEVALVAFPAGCHAVRQRLDGLLQEVYPALAHLVEECLGLPVAESALVWDADARAVRCELNLQPALVVALV